ncbi:hypothetical methyl-accepting chemotaxis protein [Marinomonas sp. MED121]|uniref:PAS domain-containing protein n=1 Tax=Marinomonas sp. MED121 TaxID=314277 RepID=UPI0000690AD6|nr:PAS domain S-box protein [Marinomonas sp. MED121]EAQ65818.1 hypothetical methyl-accepting chemotaxis protein [Marinomonas sp. MED121]
MGLAIQEQMELEVADELISVTDLDGVITYANDALLNLTGYQMDELVGELVSVLEHEDMPKVARVNLSKKLKQKRTWRGAAKKVCRDGGFFWVEENVTPIYENSRVVSFQYVAKPLKKGYKDAAIKLYAQLKEKKSAFYIVENYYFRLALYALLTLIIYMFSLVSKSLAYFYTLMPIVIYLMETKKALTFFESFSGNFDDVTRYIFSESPDHDSLL